jgi:tetratricopeptide (TPR) repeat protein
MSVNTYDYNLGTFSRRVTTSSREAQAWFDRGLVWCYSFNHEEAMRCFRAAIEHDPQCCMAHWGCAFARGPNYNKAFPLFDPADLASTFIEAFASVNRARDCSSNATPVERALIEALAARFPADRPPADLPADLIALNVAYSDAMRSVYQDHPDDLDVAMLFADALMSVSPRALWDLDTGEPCGHGTVEAREVLERAMAQPGGFAHPGILHMYIHLMEMSPVPEAALQASDRLRNLVPDAGHIAHMSTHIDAVCGDYRRAMDSNSVAIAADEKFFQRQGWMNFYTLYRAHNYQFKIYSAMLLGQSRMALEAADALAAALPEELLRMESPPMANWLEGYVPMKMHALIRFGRWEEILDAELPADRELYCVTTAMMLYAKGVAYGAMGRIEEAEATRPEFAAAASRVPESRITLPNKHVEILKVAAAMLDGELEYRKGNFDEAFAILRQAVAIDDSLLYADPRAWLQPVRHAFGALLLEQGHVAEAEAVYRADLGLDDKICRARQHPANVWSLHGYHECLTRLGKYEQAELVAAQLRIAMASVDVPIRSSCYCRLSEAKGRGC